MSATEAIIAYRVAHRRLVYANAKRDNAEALYERARQESDEAAHAFYEARNVAMRALLEGEQNPAELIDVSG